MHLNYYKIVRQKEKCSECLFQNGRAYFFALHLTNIFLQCDRSFQNDDIASRNFILE